MDLKIVLSFFVANLILVCGQDGKSFCTGYIQCTQDADNAFSSCQKLIQVSNPASSNGKAKSVKSISRALADCGSSVKDTSEKLVQKQTEQRQQERTCLTGRLNDATVEKSRQDQCKKAADEVAKGPKTRVKRASVSATAIKASANASSSGSAKNATNDYSVYAKCIKDAESKERSCRPLRACCSEITPCDFEYKLSPLHDQVMQLQYDLYKQYKQCQKDKLKAADAKGK